MAHAAVALSLAASLIAQANLPNHATAKSAKVSPAARKNAGKNSSAGAPGFQAFPFPIEQHVLKNGLRVAFVDFDSPGLVAFYTVMRVGSRNEPEKGRSGYAHFFEHMMFRGTKTHSGEDYAATMARLGLSGSASTSEDETVYHLYGPARSLPVVIQYEADRFKNLDYSESDFQTEAGAILGEYAKSASQPDQLLEEKMAGTAFTRHTYRHTTIGFLDDVKAMPQGFVYSREFFKHYYTPDNATILVVGDFDHARTLSLIEAAYSDWRGKLKAAAVAPEPQQTHAKRVRLDWPSPTLARIWMSWHVPAGSDLKSAAAQTLLEGYLFGETSALYQDLVLGRELCDSLESNSGIYLRDPTLFGVAAQVKKDADVPEVEKAIAANIRALAAGKIDRARLEAVRSNLKFSTALQLDTADRAARMLARLGAVTGDLQYPNKLYAQLDKVSALDLAAFARRYLTAANETTISLATAQKEVTK